MKSVDAKQFDVFVRNRMQKCLQIMENRAKQYATQDRLHNFKVAARITGDTLPQAVLGMMMKHLVSVLDMAAMRRDFSRADVDEKFTDLHNYLYFLEQAIVLEKEAEAERMIAKDILNKAREKAEEGMMPESKQPVSPKEYEALLKNANKSDKVRGS